MKKSLSFILAPVLAVAMFSGCGSKSSDVVKLGLGHVTKVASSKDLGTDAEGKDVLPVGQVDTVIAAVGFDKDGKVVKISFDVAQSKVNFDKTMQITSDLTAAVKTKRELGDAYGMVKASAIKKEWYQQADALEKWMIGKTVADIKAMKTKDTDKESGIPDEADLTSSVTMSVSDFIAAVDDAYSAAIDVKGNVAKVGLGHEVSIASSKALGTDSDGKEVLPVAQTDNALVAAAFDKNGKVLAAIVDNAQTKVKFSNDGKVTSDKTAEYKTKDELKEEYGMVKASSIKKEWYQQAESLAKWMDGKTVDDIKGMKTKTVGSESGVPDESELTSSVTMSVADYIAAAAEAYQNAK